MKNKLKDIFVYLFLIVASVVSIFPFYWMIAGASNKSVDVTMGKLSLGGHFIENFRNLSQLVDLKLVIGNSCKIAIISAVLSLLISSMAGYGFEIYKSKWRDRLFKLLLLAMMLPFSAMMIPLFKMFSRMGLLNSMVAVILPSSASVFFVFFFRQNTKAFQKELMEAARVDGLNELLIFFKIYMPTMKSTYAAAGIMTFMSSWNSYLWPLIVLQTPEKRTLPLALSSLSTGYTPDFGVIMTAVLISVLPTVLIFILLQKYFVQGMVGSIK